MKSITTMLLAATLWCAGAYDPKLGSNFGLCPGEGSRVSTTQGGSSGVGMGTGTGVAGVGTAGPAGGR